MSGWVTDEAKALWNGLKGVISGAFSAAKSDFSAAEAKFLPAFHAFITAEITVLEGQAMTVLEDGLATLTSTFLENGDVGAAIAALVPKVMAEVTSDIATDIAAAKNAIYTAIGLTLAQASSQKTA
jgi:hypothetical protein